MKPVSIPLVATSINYMVSSVSLRSSSGVYDDFSNNIFIDNNSLIGELKKSIIFKNDLVENSLINNRELLECLSDTLNLIANNGLYFHADLDIITDDPNDEPQILLVYYPLIPKRGTNISVQKEFSDVPHNRIYREVIRNLFKYSISIRKSVVIDERFI